MNRRGEKPRGITEEEGSQAVDRKGVANTWKLSRSGALKKTKKLLHSPLSPHKLLTTDDWNDGAPCIVATNETPELMKTKLVAGLVGALVGLSAGQTFGAVQWYQISFTGADLWTSSPDDNVSPTPAATMANPRLWVDWNASQGGANYAPLDSGSYTSFNTWKTTTPFAFSTVNLWGNGNLPLSAGGNVDVTSWGETYIASQWYGVTGPAGSSAGTSPVTSVGAIGTGSFASWANLTMGYPGYGSSVFTADVALADTSPVVGGQLRIWFDGYNSDSSAMIEGAMNVNATPISDPTVVPETGTVVSGGFALLVVVSGMLRSRFQKQA